MDSFQVANTLEVEEKIDEIVESLSLRRYRDYDPVIGISRITGKLSQLSYKLSYKLSQGVRRTSPARVIMTWNMWTALRRRRGWCSI